MTKVAGKDPAGPPDPVPNAANDLNLYSFAELPERMGT